MRTVKLGDNLLNCSVLGFGCANLMGRVGKRQSERALATAYDLGVTFYDTARSYGWGRSEEILGGFLQAKRDRVVVCTKFGTQPPPRNRFRELAKPVLRGLVSVAKRVGAATVTRFVRRRAQAHSAVAVRRGMFDIPTARASLDTSLTELRTDYVDILLLHNPTAADVADGTIFEWLGNEVRRGRVRSFGVSTNSAQAQLIAIDHPDVRVLQVPHNVFEPFDFPASCIARGIVGNVPFGSGSALVKMTELLTKHPTLVDSLPIEFTSIREGLEARLMLGYALATNTNGVTVCGMHDPNRIAANVRVAASDFRPEREAWQRFAERVLSLVPNPTLE